MTVIILTVRSRAGEYVKGGGCDRGGSWLLIVVMALGSPNRPPAPCRSQPDPTRPPDPTGPAHLVRHTGSAGPRAHRAGRSGRWRIAAGRCGPPPGSALPAC